MTPQTYFATPLMDLGAEVSRLSGLFAPSGFLHAEKRGVTSQFTTEAEAYHALHFDPARERERLSSRLASVGELPQSPIILDVGSGTGNSVIALLDLFPTAHIVATDISEDLLCILQREISARSIALGQVDIVCADLHAIELAPAKFDMVNGGSILHHLRDPAVVLAKMREGLKPGAAAIFLEPFENTYGLLRSVWLTMLADPRAAAIGATEADLLRQLIVQWEFRRGSDKSNVPDWYDDKWLFTERYFREACRDAGFRSVDILGEPPPRDVLRFTTRMSLDNLIGVGKWTLPDWVWPMIETFDHAYSDELHRDTLFLSALVVATR